MLYSRPSGSSRDTHRWGVILAGGDGVRLRPLTRLLAGDERPKQFCPLVDGKTLLDRTRQRVAVHIPRERTLLVLTRAHDPFFDGETRSNPEDLTITQPCNRGTLPAILWSLLRLVRQDPEAVVAFLPSDHHYENEAAFQEGLDRAYVAAERRRKAVILLGAAPTHPETDYGWIEPVPALRARHLRRVSRFWEKPEARVATELLARGCLWNTFIMVGAATAFLALIRRAAPLLYAAIAANFPESSALELPYAEHMYTHIPATDFSREVLARAAGWLHVLALHRLGWSDLGDPQRVLSALYAQEHRKPQRLALAAAMAAGNASCVA